MALASRARSRHRPPLPAPFAQPQVKQAMRVSGYVPGWSSAAPAIDYKGAPGFDGIFSQVGAVGGGGVGRSSVEARTQPGCSPHRKEETPPNGARIPAHRRMAPNPPAPGCPHVSAPPQLMPCPQGVSHCLKLSALPPFDPRRALEGLLDPRELWATAKELLFAARTWLGDSPRQALREASQARTLATLDVAAWGRVLATNQAPLPDIYPGRYRRCAGGGQGGCRGGGAVGACVSGTAAPHPALGRAGAL
jgi:hypothetical protein